VAPGPTLTLLRHGEATWNVERRLQGFDDTSVLTDAGRDQARAAARGLVGAVDAIVASPLARALETAREVGAVLGVEVVTDPGWRERSLGELEGRRLSDATPELVGVAGGVVVDLDAAPAGGESLAQFSERVRERARSLGATGAAGRTLVVTHGGVIRVLSAWSAGRPLLGARWGAIGNATLWRLGVPV
jgi:broad specificity phosphatase PhoE